MSAERPSTEKIKKRSPTQFFLKGLAISLPPVLTLLILIWVSQGIYDYVIRPASWVVKKTIAVSIIEESRPTDKLVRWEKLPSLPFCERDYRITSELKDQLDRRLKQRQKQNLNPETQNGLEPVDFTTKDIDLEQVYVPIGNREWCIPYKHYQVVAKNVRPSEMPRTVTDVYMVVVTHGPFERLYHLSIVLVLLTVVVLIYFLGRLVTVRVGAWAVSRVETLILVRLPIISNVYSSVKQVTDFFFTDRTVEYNRVVAVEYPRRGVWSVGFVTSDSMLDISAAAGEPLLSVLMPTSPMPMTGFTISVPRSEVLDLNITIEQAFQYCLSCGVLVPPQQMVTKELLQQELAKRLAASMTEVSQVEENRAKLPHADRTPITHSDDLESEGPP